MVTKRESFTFLHTYILMVEVTCTVRQLKMANCIVATLGIVATYSWYQFIPILLSFIDVRRITTYYWIIQGDGTLFL